MNVTAIVLAGGLGTRLRSVVVDRPKVLAPVAGQPFIEYLLAQLDDVGIRHVIVSTGYLAEQLADVLGDRYGTVRLEYVREESPLGTGGAIKWAGRRATHPTVLVMNGDSFVDADLAAFLQWHHQQGNDASLLLVEVADASRYGTVEVDDEGRVTAFVEKRPVSEPACINAGVYALKRSLVEKIPPRQLFSRSGCFAKMAGRVSGGGVGEAGAFIDIGIPADYQRSQRFMGNFKRV